MTNNTRATISTTSPMMNSNSKQEKIHSLQITTSLQEITPKKTTIRHNDSNINNNRKDDDPNILGLIQDLQIDQLQHLVGPQRPILMCFLNICQLNYINYLEYLDQLFDQSLKIVIVTGDQNFQSPNPNFTLVLDDQLIISKRFKLIDPLSDKFHLNSMLLFNTQGDLLIKYLINYDKSFNLNKLKDYLVNYISL